MPTQLQQIQQEILNRFKRPQPSDEGKVPGVPRGALPQPINATTSGQPLPHPIDAPRGGVALGQQRSVFAPPQQSNGQTLTPTNQEAITRQRNVFAPPQQVSDPAATARAEWDAARNAQPNPNVPFGSSGEPFEAGRPRRTQPRDYVADDTQYLRDLNAQPRGKKDIAVDVLRSLNSVWGSNPKAYTPTKREREIGQTEQRIGQGLEIQKQQTQAEAARQRADQGQQRIDQGQQRIDAAAERTRGYLDNLQSLPAREKKRMTAQLLKTGALNTPEGLKYAAEVLGVPVPLQEAFIRGEHRDAIDDEGNFIDINRRTNQAAPVIQDGQPVRSFAETQEVGRERRATAAQVGANTRASNAQQGANERAAGRVTTGNGRDPGGKPNAKANRLVREYNQARTTEMNYGATRTSDKPADPAAKAQLQSNRENLWQEIMSTYPGMFEAGDDGRLQAKAQSSAQTRGAWNPQRFSAAFKAKNGRAPTQAEIDAYAAAAQ